MNLSGRSSNDSAVEGERGRSERERERECERLKKICVYGRQVLNYISKYYHLAIINCQKFWLISVDNGRVQGY